MKWLLIVKIIFSDGDIYIGPFTEDEYTKQECMIAFEQLSTTIFDQRIKLAGITCLQSTAI